MATIGKISIQNEAVDVVYSLDMQRKVVDITDFDSRGFRILHNLAIGDQLVLQLEDGKSIKIQVVKLVLSQHVECFALLVD